MKARRGSVPNVKRAGAQFAFGRHGTASSKPALEMDTPRVVGPIVRRTCSRSSP